MKLWRGPGPCSGGRGEAGGLGLVDGVPGDCVWTVPLSFETTVELVQIVGQAQVVSRVGGSGFVMGELSEPLPDRSRVLG